MLSGLVLVSRYVVDFLSSIFPLFTPIQAAIVLSASVSLPGFDDLGRITGFVAILYSAASMISAVIALSRYKADVERAVVYMDGEGLVMLSVSLPYPLTDLH